MSEGISPRKRARRTLRRGVSQEARSRTWSYFVAIVLLLLGSFAVVGGFSHSVPNRFQFSLSGAPLGAAGLAVPSVASTVGQESSWYCTWSLPSEVSLASSTVDVFNASPRQATVSASSSLSQKKPKVVKVAPWSSLALTLKQFSRGSTGGVTLVTVGGRTVASLQYSYGGHVEQEPCQVTPGFFWMSTGLFTLHGDTSTVAIYNPFASTAVVDVVALSDQGISAPSSLQGIVVLPGETVRVLASSMLAPTQAGGVEVRARSGRVVVGATVLRADQFASGLSFPPTTTRPSPSWEFPFVASTPGSESTVVLANPSDRSASLVLSVTPFSSKAPSSSASGVVAAPTITRVTLAPASLLSVPLSASSGVPANGAFVLSVTDKSAVGIGAAVASNLAVATSTSVFVEPDETPLTAKDWILEESAGATSDTSVFGRLAVELPVGGGDLMTISDRSITAQGGTSSVAVNPIVRENHGQELFNMQASGVLALPPPGGSSVYFVRGARALALAPTYSTLSTESFLALPLRG